MRQLLFLKHWQLFLLFIWVALPDLPGPLDDILQVIAFMGFLLWVYAIGYYGQEKVAALRLRSMNLKLFQFNWLFIGMMIAITSVFPTHRLPNTAITEIPYTILSIYGGAAALQVLLFAAKTVAKVEKRREANFSDCIINFFQIATSVLGVWGIQPRINQLIAPREVLL